MKASIEVIKAPDFLKIINHSDLVLEIHLVPKKPKRKVHVEMVIHPKQSYIADHTGDYHIRDYFFRFVEDK
jgi:hypothetical protein